VNRIADELPSGQGTTESVLEILKTIRPECDFHKDVNLIADAMLDSFDLTMLVAALEERFGLAISGTDIVPEYFQNIGAIVGLLDKYGAKT
jgi:acyl carrier protein